MKQAPQDNLLPAADIDTAADSRGEVEIDLLELFGHFRQRLLFIVAGFLIGALIAGLITQFAITPKYTATSKRYMVSSSSQSGVLPLTEITLPPVMLSGCRSSP